MSLSARMLLLLLLVMITDCDVTSSAKTKLGKYKLLSCCILHRLTLDVASSVCVSHDREPHK